MAGLILKWLGDLLGGPFAKAAVDAYKVKLDAENSKDSHTADLLARELAVQQSEIDVQAKLKTAQIGHPWEPEKLFAYIIVLYFGKIVVWDKIIGSLAGYTRNIFNTDALTGDAVGWAAMVMAFYFGKRGVENVARILKR
ncbi:hypothetical protein ASD45_08625 [Pseudolabrys sp. Root1462]|uniref:hypothetical protein n=1 Tax=Pseudolabrys sp. Root1462 TaxID=1736466 RepID=UPI000702C16B|nr:hypothetical protein [Pseudolabrys sp. Root1462]KQZ00917.1 hypothetical protein ASD45_08625 [Pseudolabrys sp. Root1462]